MEHAIICPQCNAPLAPHPFARSVVCSYCGATVQLDALSSVSAELFHQAFRTWNSPASYGIPAWFSIGESHWVLGECIGHGEISDVYLGQRARWPTELVIIKLLHDRAGLARFDNEWKVLQELQNSQANGSDTFARLLPQPVIHGEMTHGSNVGQRVNIYRWASGFRHTFDEVFKVYPQGIPPRASIWVWRRILEILSFIHNSGKVHGAVLPSHLLVQENEHGIRLVGYGSAGHPGEKLPTLSNQYSSFYPKSIRSRSSLTMQLDLIMSARCIAALLGGNPETASLPAAVPSRLARLVQRVALSDHINSEKSDAWSIREELGDIAGKVFGAPQFIPIVMPS